MVRSCIENERSPLAAKEGKPPSPEFNQNFAAMQHGMAGRGFSDTWARQTDRREPGLDVPMP
jgi:hypothetical protein